MSDLAGTLLADFHFRFAKVKELGERALGQVAERDLHWQPSPEGNSLAVLIQHLHGNMLSRWTDFLTSDGDKPWRDRDGEFTARPERTRIALMVLWEEGWARLFSALDALEPRDLLSTVKIRGEEMTALDAILRQLSHYSYHVGQIVEIARMRCGDRWQTLSIPRGQSSAYRPAERD